MQNEFEKHPAISMSNKQTKGATAAASVTTLTTVTEDEFPFKYIQVEVQAKLQANHGVLTQNNVSVMEALQYMNAKVSIHSVVAQVCPELTREPGIGGTSLHPHCGETRRRRDEIPLQNSSIYRLHSQRKLTLEADRVPGYSRVFRVIYGVLW